MIKESDFIIETLKKWNNKFDGIHIRYGYDKPSEYHVIEISPDIWRKHNKQYKDAEFKLWAKFTELYPKSDLLISEPCSNTECINDNLLYEN